MSLGTNTQFRLPQIDALRGFAALGVFIFHLAAVVGFPKRVLPPFSVFNHVFDQIPSVFSFGATGVSLFFIVSGFCLTVKPLRSGARLIFVKGYAIDRFVRVYPAYVVAVVFSLGCVILLNEKWTLWELFTVATFMQGFVQKWHFGLNGALWSMSTEVQFYVLFPAIFWLFVRSSSRAFILLSLFATLLFRLQSANTLDADMVVGGINTGTFLMNSLLGRIFEFTCGLLLARLFTDNYERLRLISKFAVLPACAFGVSGRIAFPTWLADPAVGIMYFAIVGFALTHLNLQQRNVFAKFGRMSYSFFLVHVPVISICAATVTFDAQRGLYEKFVTLGVASFVASGVASALLHLLVERRFSDWLKQHSHRKS